MGGKPMPLFKVAHCPKVKGLAKYPQSAKGAGMTSDIGKVRRFFQTLTLRLALALACIAPLSTAHADSAPGKARPALGTYHWPNGTAGVDAFAARLGRDAVWGLDFVGGESWSDVGWPVFWLEHWSKWVKAKPGRRLVLSIPILAGPVDGSGPKQGDVGVNVPVSLEKGAAGDYNIRFQQLAENLVKHGLADTILRPAWEFNGDWYAWRAKGKTAAFAEYWRQIVKTMHAVPGTEALKFCWNPTLGDQQFPADEAWPGDAFVDFVGVDVYDETWHADTYPFPADAIAAEIERRQKKAWDEWIMASPRGLAFWVKFAKDHGKPLAIPEWGLVWAAHNHGGLDDVHFIEQMHAFIHDQKTMSRSTATSTSTRATTATSFRPA